MLDGSPVVIRATAPTAGAVDRPPSASVFAIGTFAATLFLSGALLFSVQPMVGKRLLPFVGGAPAVWNSCMLFFQAALLGGYVYAHVLTRRFSLRGQAWIHLGVLAAGLFALPIELPSGLLDSLPRDSSPLFWLLAALARSVGLPFFALAASAPLFGTWFARAAGERGAYALYAASNVGSLIGLLSYPLLLEPRLELAEQSRYWAAGYIALVAFAAMAAVTARKDGDTFDFADSPTSPRRSGHEPTQLPASGISAQRRLRWLALAFVPSSLTLGATTYLTTDVAAVPLLWVLPLSLYLLSFVLVFAPRPLRPPPWAGRGYALLTVCLLVGLVTDSIHSITIAIPFHLAALFLASIVLHGALAADRPAVDRLAEYFLWISVGGVCGGIWNALVAPELFTNVDEYPLAMILGCLLLPGGERRGKRGRALDLALPAALGGALALAIFAVQSRMPVPGRLTTVAVFLPAALFAYSFVARPARFALGLLALFAASTFFTTGHGGIVRSERNFFGVVRLARDGPGRFLQLVHGNTLHGRQALAAETRCEPSVYYHRQGPVGEVFRRLRMPPGAEVAVIGLGAGSLAAFAEPGERWTFYEINPAIVAIAEHDFRFLADCFAGSSRDVRLGDGRLEIAAAASHAYRRIVLDAFDSDSIPVHLLTREALALDLEKLADGGTILVHVSNTFLDLRPVAAALAADAGLVAYIRDDRDPVPATGKEASRWAVLARSAVDLAPLAAAGGWSPLTASSTTRPWTDAYSNLWGAIDWRLRP